MQRLSLFLFLICIYSCNSPTQKPTPKETVEKELSLEKTKWNSQFYQYNNFYHFTDKSNGYSQDGQVAWGCPIDLEANKIPGNKILYNEKEAFTYEITNSKLTIHYLNRDTSQTPMEDRVFSHRKKYQDWISDYTYVYGSEILQAGKRNEFFDESGTPQIKSSN
jgi:hypothetical protein